MVDPIGWKATAPTGRTIASTPVSAPASISVSTAEPIRAADVSATDTAATSGAAQQLAAEPPVDTERVARIKAAIAAGKFPILPSTIADRLLAFKLEWNGNEQA